IIACAQQRRESRGLHYTIDHPEPDPAWGRDKVIRRGAEGSPAPAAGPPPQENLPAASAGAGAQARRDDPDPLLRAEGCDESGFEIPVPDERGMRVTPTAVPPRGSLPRPATGAPAARAPRTARAR